jgi:hypothetical protein
MDFLSRKSWREQKVLTLLFFSLSKQHRNPSQNRKKKHQREKKNVCHFIFAARACVAKEKRDERDARKSSFSSYSSPFTVLARCHASFRHGFFERVSERNFKSSRVSNVSVRFICLSSSPFLVLRASSCARDVLFLRAFSLSLSLKTETKDAL